MKNGLDILEKLPPLQTRVGPAKGSSADLDGRMAEQWLLAELVGILSLGADWMGMGCY